MEFEWDENKNKSNQLKHGISFEEATQIFDDEKRVEYQDFRKD
ncbi:MAG: BrnT family toxin [Saprospiraceae bacterium]|nr:BrnT family toxin [Saprospiraceae bacterium]